MALAISTVSLGLERRPAGPMTRAAGGFLVLLILVWRFEGQGRLGILSKKLVMAHFAIVLFTIGVSSVLKGDVPGLRLEHEFRRRRFVLRQQRCQAEHRKEETVSQRFPHIRT